MKILFKVLLILAGAVAIASCGGGDDDGLDEDNTSTHVRDYVREKKLFNTIWVFVQQVSSDGSSTTLPGLKKDESTYITFTNSLVGGNGENADKYILKYGDTNLGYWYILGEDLRLVWDRTINKDLAIEARAAYGVIGTITTLTSTNLNYKAGSAESYHTRYLKRVSSSSSEESGGGSTTTSYEKPSVGFYNFTAGYTTLKVQYKIYNKDKAKVTSAKIYYGTSSNPTKSKTATVSGVMITGNISGLKKGTTYYVKCKVTGKGGTTTTSATKCITNY